MTAPSVSFAGNLTDQPEVDGVLCLIRRGPAELADSGRPVAGPEDLL
jgi:hypothetical protein